MRQVIQNYSSGDLRLETVPAPICQPGGVLVRTAYSLVSTGTERMKVEQARMSLVGKARARPDKVKQVVQSIRQVGLAETYGKIRERLEALTPLGYSLAGTVEEVGRGVDEFAVGDRVACAGEGIACHAEFVFVPRNLCVRVPAGVELKDAAFATVGAIALNGVRQAGVSVGDSVLVIGLGLVGLVAVQILKAAGCCVIGVDVDADRVTLAKQCGADVALVRDDPALKDTIEHVTDGIGADAAYIAASTQSADPMRLAGEVVRDRGRVVVVGMVKVEADWQTYYHKELSVVMSRSYGPGRYDRNFEQKGIDYPVGYVRWTERRNLQEFVRLIGTGQVNPSRLAPDVFEFENAPEAYQQLREAPGRHATGILFKYPDDATTQRHIAISSPSRNGKAKLNTIGVGLIGAGNFATATLIPALKRIPEVRLRGICSARGLSARSAGGRHGFEYCTSDYHELLNDESIGAVVIATRHDTHARLAAESARAGKDVFVEKPLALDRVELDEVIAAQHETGRIIMPGFNRRFSPLSIAVRDAFAGHSAPLEIVCRVNAGAVSQDSWYKDQDEAGWRILSEGCHFIDLIQFICGFPPKSIYASVIGAGAAGQRNDNCIVTLKMMDGSLATLIYVANGDPSYEKERIEVFGQGSTAVIENWRSARIFTNGRSRTIRPKGTLKGHGAELATFIRAATRGDDRLPPFTHGVTTTLATFAILDSIQTNCPVPIATCSSL